MRARGQGALGALPEDSVVAVAEFAFEGMAPRCRLSDTAPLTQGGKATLADVVAKHVPRSKPAGWFGGLF